MESEGCIHAYPCTFGWNVVGHNGANWGHQDRNHEIPSKHPRLQHRIASCHQPSVLPFAWPEFLRMTLDVLWEWILSENPQKRNPERLRFLPRGALTSHLKYLLIYLNYIHPKMNISIIIFNRMIFFVQTNWNPNGIQRRWLQEWWLSGLIFSIALNVDF